MALALRLRRALAATPHLLRPLTAAAPTAATPPLPRAAPASAPPRRPQLLASAAGFRSSSAAMARGGEYGGGEESKISPDDVLFEGCDYNHWLITMEFPNDPKPTREEMIETYLQTLAKVVGSYEEAKRRMYALSTTTYTGFQAVMTEEMSEKFRGLPGVVFILPDSYLYPETKEYGGDKYDNGVITPRPPPVLYQRHQRNDRSRNNYGGPQQQGNYQNNPPRQQNFQNYPSQQGDGRSYAPQQSYARAGEDVRGYGRNDYAQAGQDGRGYGRNDYAQAGQDGRGYGRNDYSDRTGYSGPPGGYQADRGGPAPQYQANVNPGSQGQGYYNPQEQRNFPQGHSGDFKPGGPSAQGNYGQPSASGYAGGENWQRGGDGSYPASPEGQPGTWQGGSES